MRVFHVQGFQCTTQGWPMLGVVVWVFATIYTVSVKVSDSEGVEVWGYRFQGLVLQLQIWVILTFGVAWFQFGQTQNIWFCGVEAHPMGSKVTVIPQCARQNLESGCSVRCQIYHVWVVGLLGVWGLGSKFFGHTCEIKLQTQTMILIHVATLFRFHQWNLHPKLSPLSTPPTSPLYLPWTLPKLLILPWPFPADGNVLDLFPEVQVLRSREFRDLGIRVGSLRIEVWLG